MNVQVCQRQCKFKNLFEEKRKVLYLQKQQSVLHILSVDKKPSTQSHKQSHHKNRNWAFHYLHRRGNGKHEAQVNRELENVSSLVWMAALLRENDLLFLSSGRKIEIPLISSSEVVHIAK